MFVGLLGACAGSDDSNSDSDLDTFCEEITALAQSDADTTEAEDVAALRSLADAAPSAISGDLDDMVDGLRQLQGFDAETASDEEMAGFLDMIDGLDEASVRVEEFALANCADMPADLFATP